MGEKLHRSSFLKELRARCPDIEPWLEGYRLSITEEILAFCLYTQDAIDRGDMARVQRCLEFTDWAFTRSNAMLRNAIAVSYLEHLKFSGQNGERALRFLSPLLAAERANVLDYLAELGSSARWRKR